MNALEEARAWLRGEIDRDPRELVRRLVREAEAMALLEGPCRAAALDVMLTGTGVIRVERVAPEDFMFRPQPAGEDAEALRAMLDDLPPSLRKSAERELAEIDAATPPSDAPERDAVGALVEKWSHLDPSDEPPTEFDLGYEQAMQECRTELAAALGSRPVVDEAVVSHHWIGEEMMRERTRVETNTGRIVARIRRDTLSSEWAWGQEWYVNEAAARAAVERKFPSALSRTQEPQS